MTVQETIERRVSCRLRARSGSGGARGAHPGGRAAGSVSMQPAAVAVRVVRDAALRRRVVTDGFLPGLAMRGPWTRPCWW